MPIAYYEEEEEEDDKRKTGHYIDKFNDGRGMLAVFNSVKTNYNC